MVIQAASRVQQDSQTSNLTTGSTGSIPMGLGATQDTISASQNSQGIDETNSCQNRPELENDQKHRVFLYMKALSVQDLLGIAFVARKKGKIKELEKGLLDGAHPLTFLLHLAFNHRHDLEKMYFIFNKWTKWDINKSFINALGGNAWNSFVQQLKSKLTESHKQGQLLDQLRGFSKKRGLNCEILKGYVEAGKWERFICMCIGINHD